VVNFTGFCTGCGVNSYYIDVENNTLKACNGGVRSSFSITQKTEPKAANYSVNIIDYDKSEVFYFNQNNPNFKIQLETPYGLKDTTLHFQPNAEYIIQGLEGGEGSPVNIKLKTDSNSKVVSFISSRGC
jgi:hypothetical protein